MDHILSLVDGSEPSYRALEYATKLSKCLDAKLIVLAGQSFGLGAMSGTAAGLETVA